MTDKKEFTFKIKAEYQNFMPRAGKLDDETLTAQIKKDGLIDPIETLADGTVIDGHSRLKILEKLKMKVPPDKIKIVDLNTPEEIREYIFNKNVARRHLTDLQKIDLVKKFVPSIKAEVKEKTKEKISKGMTDKKAKAGKAPKKKEKKAPQEATRKKVAEKAGVSEGAVRQEQFLSDYAPELLVEAKQKGLHLGNVYMRALEMWNHVKKNDADLFKKVKAKEVKLADAFKTVAEKKPLEKKALGPKTQLTSEIYDMVQKIVIKHHDGKFEPTDCEKEILDKLKEMVRRFDEKGV